MHLIKSLFTLWLILSLLGLGTAWALDSHALFAGQKAVSEPSLQDAPDDGDCADGHHCGHLGFHLLGVPGSARAPFLGGDHRHFACAERDLTSTPRAPPGQTAPLLIPIAVPCRRATCPPALPAAIPAPDLEPEGTEAMATKHPAVREAHLRALAEERRIRMSDLVRRADTTIGVKDGHEDRDTLGGLRLEIPLQVRNDYSEQMVAARA